LATSLILYFCRLFDDGVVTKILKAQVWQSPAWRAVLTTTYIVNWNQGNKVLLHLHSEKSAAR
jgi:hypothetical protein